MYCFNCGKEIKEEYNVCPYCGQQLKDKELTEPKENEQPNKSEPIAEPTAEPIVAQSEPVVEKDSEPSAAQGEPIGKKESKAKKSSKKFFTQKNGLSILSTCIVCFILALALTILPIILSGGFSNCSKSCATSQAEKKEPSITSTRTLSGVVVTIHANDDYDFVTVIIEYLDYDDNVVASEELTIRNLIAGNFYQLQSTRSLDKIENFAGHNCSVKNYG